jgi:hypothetical protein
MNKTEIAAHLAAHLPAPLVPRLDVRDHQVSTKLATCNDVFMSFDEMVSLYRLAHSGPFRYGPGHACNARPEDILRDWSSLYLGPWPRDDTKKPTVLISQDLNDDVDHHEVWRRTKQVQRKDGTWYHRQLSQEETGGNPNGRRVPCPNSDRPFRAAKVGFAWNAEHNIGRDLYRCKPCGRLFNAGEYDTPRYAELAEELCAPDEPDEQVERLEGCALLYHVHRPGHASVGIDYVVDGAVAIAEKDSPVDAARYLSMVEDERLEVLTLQQERPWDECTHLPFTMDELETFAQLYHAVYWFHTR